MKSKKLDEGFGSALQNLFDYSAAGKRFLSLISDPSADLPDISEILERHDPAYVSSLNESIRRETEFQFYRVFGSRTFRSTIEAERFIQTILSVSPESAFPLMTIWAGYAREAAVRAITSIPGPFCLALLILRTNDWVEQVRIAALAKLKELSENLSTVTITDCAEAILQAGRFGRIEAETGPVLESLISRPAVLDSLFDRWRHSRDNRAPRILRLALRSTLFDDRLAKLAAKGPHVMVRAISTAALLNGEHRWADRNALHHRPIETTADPGEIARQALDDQSPLVQKIAIQYVIQHRDKWADAEQIFRRFLVHKSLPVGERALFGLNAMNVDGLHELRSQLIGPSGPRGQVARLLERNGDESDAERLMEIAQSLAPDKALPFLSASAGLGNGKARQCLIRMSLTCPDLSVARRAARALRRSGGSIDNEDLVRAAESGQSFVERGLMQFVVALPPIRHLAILCELRSAGVDLDLDAQFLMLDRKRNKGLFAPSQHELDDLASKIYAVPEIRERAQISLGLKF